MSVDHVEAGPVATYALGTHFYRLPRLALGESDVQDTFLDKR